MVDSIKDEVKSIDEGQGKIVIVDDMTLNGEIESKLFEKCDQELKNTFNIEDSKDLGEYKTLLYAKFSKVKLLSSQDTTVWRFVTESLYFNDIDCITMQDIAYLIYLNASNRRDRKSAKGLYKSFGRKEHSFNNFKKYMKRNGNEVPQYIEFENNRINNFNDLVKGYNDVYGDDVFYSREEIEKKIVDVAKNNTDTCKSCLYSRVNEENIDYNDRICSLGYNLDDENCSITREEFCNYIKSR